MAQYQVVHFNLNGKDVEKVVDVRASLTDMLRNDFRMTSVKKVAGGIMDKTLPIEGSNVMLVNPKTGKGDRVGYKVVDGKKVRVFKSDGAVVGAKA